ncbi:MAG TPA: DUF2480 family protein [Chryseolinea sp.]
MQEPQDHIINRVTNSSLVTFDLEDYFVPGERVQLDIKDQLYEGIILKEKDFRDFIKANRWEEFQDKFVAINCSVDAIIPTWAYMLLAIAMEPFARKVVFGTLEELEIAIFQESLKNVEWANFKGSKVVVKGCSKVNVPVAIYVDVASKLQRYASSIMYGEPCSTVPLFKKPKA